MKKNTAQTLTEVMLRLDEKDRQKLLKKLYNGMGIGEEITLTVTDYRNRFDLGEFVAVIKEWKPLISGRWDDEEEKLC